VFEKMKTPQKDERSVSDKTRQKILSATGKVFAQGGYRAMTLRQVTHEAKVNLAAVLLISLVIQITR
jgi:AcrR family transcriptional regulator